MRSFSALRKLACARAQKKILSTARAHAQFFESLALSLALSKKWAPLNFALIFKSILAVFKHKIIQSFNFWLLFQRSTSKAENSMKIEEICGRKCLNFIQQFSKNNLRSRSADFGCALAHLWTFECRSRSRSERR